MPVSTTFTMKKSAFPGVVVLCLLLVSACAPAPVEETAAETAEPDVLRYQVDASWPKELPNNWILWNSTGLHVDADDHIWIINRPRQVSMADAGAAQTPPISECCIPAPSVVEFDGSCRAMVKLASTSNPHVHTNYGNRAMEPLAHACMPFLLIIATKSDNPRNNSLRVRTQMKGERHMMNKCSKGSLKKPGLKECSTRNIGGPARFPD